MIDEEIFELADKLQQKLLEQNQIAKKAMEAIPEGETKDMLSDLMKKATAGTLKPEDAFREISKIVKQCQ